jgi:hypothetical protein
LQQPKDKAKMDEARIPYAIRMKEARAAARAKRKAIEKERLRQLPLIATTNWLAKQAVRASIRAAGKKFTDYSVKEINLRAEALMPQFVEQARAKIDWQGNNEELHAIIFQRAV